MLPVELVLIRHGQSEGNAILHEARHGDTSKITEEFLQRHSSQWRLTPTGVKQARQCGEWLRNNNLGGFHRYYTSDLVRAKETAGELNLLNACWYTDPLLNEREYGTIDPSTNMYLSDSFEHAAEPLDNLLTRIDRFLQTLYRENEGNKVVIVSHGEVMMVFRLLIERMTFKQWQKLHKSKDPTERINNCQILHYTRKNPENEHKNNHFSWVRSICPNKEDWSQPNWRHFLRPMFTNKELINEAEQYPHLKY